MQSAAPKNSKLPFKGCMVCVSPVGGTLLMVLIYIVYCMVYTSIDAAMWVAGGVFCMAAIYETFLMSLITRHMLNRVNVIQESHRLCQDKQDQI